MKLLDRLDCPTDRAHWLAVGALLVVAVVLRALAFQGFADSDPRAYAIIADKLAQGVLSIPGYPGPPVFPLRIGTYGPSAGLIGIFGLSEFALVAYPFLVSIAGCALVYVFARYVFSPLAGLSSLLFAAVLPLDLQMASLLYPDAIAAFWSNAAVVTAWFAIDSSSRRRAALLGLASGLLFGISWLCKETVVYLVPFVLLLIFMGNRHASSSTRTLCCAAIGIGSMAVLATEIAAYAILAGDPLFRLHETERNYEFAAVWFFDSSSPYFGWNDGAEWKAVVKRLLHVGPVEILMNRALGLLPLIGCVAGAWAIVFKFRRGYLLIAWLLSLMLLFNFMSSSFTSYKPLVLFDRYLYPLLFPAMALTGGWLARLATEPNQVLHLERKFWSAVVVAVVLFVCAMRLPSVLNSRPELLERHVSAHVTADDLVFTDCRSALSLRFFRDSVLASSSATTRAYETVSATSIPAGAYVLVNRTKLSFLAKSYRYQPPSFIANPPASWKKVASHFDGELYSVGPAVPPMYSEPYSPAINAARSCPWS